MKILKTPFKFLDSYQKEDYNIFFGREKEIEGLYHALSGVKHLLVYGPSGAGKTSLVECGLRNQFSDADWFALTVRRRGDMMASFYSYINEHLSEQIPLAEDTRLPIEAGVGFGHAIERLFEERYQPVYLLFDQFEELLIQGETKEKTDFFTGLNELIRYKVPCRVILIMREEFIGYLSEYEHLCPSIFQHRFRLEKMNKSHVRGMLVDTLTAPSLQGYFSTTDPGALADGILSRIPDDKFEIELAHVQVFLTELWQRALALAEEGALPRLHLGLVRPEDQLEGILDNFLKDQLWDLLPVYGEKAPLEVLVAMISERYTKLQVSLAGLASELERREVPLPRPLIDLVRELVERKILRATRSGSEVEYEISHDVLALVVGRNQTEEMKLREEAAKVYSVYEGRAGMFSREDMDHMRPYQRYKACPPSLQRRIEESEAFLQAAAIRAQQEKEAELVRQKAIAEQEAVLRKEAEIQKEVAEKAKRRATWFAWGAVVLAVLGVALAVYAYRQSQVAKRETANAVKSAKEAQIARDSATAQKAVAEAQRFIADSSAVVAREQTGIAQQKTKEAEANLDKAQKAESRALSALEQVQREKAATEEQRRKAEENAVLAKAAETRALEALEQVQREKAATEEQRRKAEENYRIAQEKTKEAEASADQARKALEDTQKALEEVVRLSLQEADELIKRLDYAGAVEKIYSLIPLGVSEDRLATALLEPAFWYAETGDLPHAWGILDTAYQLAGRRLVAPGKSLENLRSALRTLDAEQDAFLQARYFPKMMPIKGGEFTMGSEGGESDEKPPHRVQVSDFQMAETETTWWQYGLYVTAREGEVDMPSAPGWGISGDNPVVNVSWYAAIEYANWLSGRMGVERAYPETGENSSWPGPGRPGYRLPTEAEWEYAAAGGKQQKYAGTDEEGVLGDYAWYDDNGGSRTRPVRSKKENPFGLYDMSGNVWEWCWDWYGEAYYAQCAQQGVVQDPMGPSSGDYRVLRGGGWSSSSGDCRVSDRRSGYPSSEDYIGGFRVVRQF
jgi:formylglycine-generating enzyme required for sulfatase activity